MNSDIIEFPEGITFTLNVYFMSEVNGKVVTFQIPNLKSFPDDWQATLPDFVDTIMGGLDPQQGPWFPLSHDEIAKYLGNANQYKETAYTSKYPGDDETSKF